jgi:hypothetical protein
VPRDSYESETRILGGKSLRLPWAIICLLCAFACAGNTFAQAKRRAAKPQPKQTQQAKRISKPKREPAVPPLPVLPEIRSDADVQDADVAIIANVTAKELRFDAVPNPSVEFLGKDKTQTIWHADRYNLPDKIEPGVTYRNVGIRLKITSRLADIERIVAEALGEVPVTDDAAKKDAGASAAAVQIDPKATVVPTQQPNVTAPPKKVPHD